MEILSEKSKIGGKVYNTTYSQVVTQSSTDAAQQDLTSVIGREPVFFLKRLEELFLCTILELIYQLIKYPRFYNSVIKINNILQCSSIFYIIHKLQ